MGVSLAGDNAADAVDAVAEAAVVVVAAAYQASDGP